jgi:hypothetical protein
MAVFSFGPDNALYYEYTRLPRMVLSPLFFSTRLPGLPRTGKRVIGPKAQSSGSRHPGLQHARPEPTAPSAPVWSFQRPAW